RFLYKAGSLYLCFNNNLLFHGCVPLDKEGQFESVLVDGNYYSGKRYMDEIDHIARRAYSKERKPNDLDFMWYLWGGCKSPFCGRVIKTFERMWVTDKAAWVEPQNDYYVFCKQEAYCRMVLREFGLYGDFCHIINGHLPVKVIQGEKPVKGGGVMIIIDGGFCKAYQKTTGIAGYTLIFNSHSMRLKAHKPFKGKANALQSNADMQSESEVIAYSPTRIMVNDTDNGRQLRDQIADLTELAKIYQSNHLMMQDTKKRETF
ncbi:MAG TPA: class 3 fructose-bisphosphatase, partial [Ruminococcaceae bacterium]|nr:class 3 fructose-bisphosphatase [Oscillospiraceae bacterium]